MKYFRVEEEYLTGTIKRIEVASDGDPIGDSYEVRDNDSTNGITIGYHVFEEDEQGITQNVEFYPVATDMRTFESNALEVLEQIKGDYPAGEWQKGRLRMRALDYNRLHERKQEDVPTRFGADLWDFANENLKELKGD